MLVNVHTKDGSLSGRLRKVTDYSLLTFVAARHYDLTHGLSFS